MKKSEFHVKYVKWYKGVEASKTVTSSDYLVALTLATILAFIALAAYTDPLAAPVTVTTAEQFFGSKRATHTPYLAPLAAAITPNVPLDVSSSMYVPSKVALVGYHVLETVLYVTIAPDTAAVEPAIATAAD